MKVAVIGECMVELSDAHYALNKKFGGDTLNTAIYLSRLLKGSDIRISYVTGLGVDPFSDEMISAWENEGISTELVYRDNKKLPGIYYIKTRSDGEREFFYWRNDSAARYWLATSSSDYILQELSHYDCFYLSGISLAILDELSRSVLIDALKLYQAQGKKIIFDSNYRTRLWSSKEETRKIYSDMMNFIDTTFLTLEDETELWGDISITDIIKRWSEKGVREIVIKRGSDPCVIYSDGSLFEVPAVLIPPEKVIDTTAAGDSFSAGYLSRILAGSSPYLAAEMGHSLASKVVQHHGAIIPSDEMI